jgi:hypothetical protein
MRCTLPSTSPISFLTHSASFTAVDAEMYSASVVDVATTVCNFAPHRIGHPFININIPEVLLLLSNPPARSASE